MSDSVTTSIEVAASPEIAFDVFVREIDAWYRADPSALPDITRTAAIRFEPWLGGRLLDVHDLASGEGRELGRITVWEPAHRLVFVDNEGSEVDVRFERQGEGARVTLTHRGLDRLAPKRAAALRRSGWAALALLYRDHLAPNARPIALAVAAVALPLAIANIAFLLLSGQPSVLVVTGSCVVIFAVGLAFSGIEDRLVARRWLPSYWQYRRILRRLWGVAVLGLLLWGLFGAITDGGDWFLIGLCGLLLMLWWEDAQEGPAAGRSLRTRAEPGRTTFRERHYNVGLVLVFAGLLALTLGTFSGLASIDARLHDITLGVMLAVIAARVLRRVVSKRRQKRALGFNPDFYVAVDRQVDEQDRRPELLVHHPSEQPEYSGWYAYADGPHEGPRDLVAWSMKDLIEHSPETAHPLREGHGRWRWDPHLGAYKPIEGGTEQAQPA